MSDTLPRLSIIVPVFNNALTIQDCLQSLLNQDYPRSFVEIIAVDNNSTDRSAQIIQGMPVGYTQETTRQSAAAARNKGASMAQGDILVFIDADSVASSDWLSKLILNPGDERIGGWGGVNTYYQDDQTIAFKMQAMEWAAFQKNLETNPQDFYQIGGNAAIRKTAFNQLNGFDISLRSSEDYDLFYRLQKQLNLKISVNPQAVVFNKTRNWKSLLKREFRIGYGDANFMSKYHLPGKNIFILFFKRLVRTLTGILTILVQIILPCCWPEAKIKIKTILLDIFMQWSNFLGRIHYYFDFKKCGVPKNW